MFKKLSFRQKLFINLFLIFLVFTLLVLVFQYNREKKYKTDALNKELSTITDLCFNFVEQNDLLRHKKFEQLDSLMQILPNKTLRISLIAQDGKVLYDSEVKEITQMENHLQRPEITKASKKQVGTDVRKSATTGQSYYYFAANYDLCYIRSAAVYGISVKDFLRIEKSFITYLFFLFVLIAIALLILTNGISRTITKLKDFAIRLSSGENYAENISFPNDELGSISNRIIEIYNKLNRAREKTALANRKLFGHLHALNEGIAFFSPDKQKTLNNNHFIQFLNVISEETSVLPENIFEISEFKPIIKFIDNQLINSETIYQNKLPQAELNIKKSGKYFHVECIIFHDKSFEIIIKDVTKLEKRKRLKKQMTSNIAHELKTPVTTIMGYLETLQTNKVPEEKHQYFIERAYIQANRLSSLIQDLSVLNKIEESKELFNFEKINLNTIISEITSNLEVLLNEKNIKVEPHLSEEMIINGNQSLLFSIFYNLFDNAIKYGGENCKIFIKNYHEDEKFFYFSFSNSGENIEKEHLNKIFERFYRIDSGRSRKKGGTGLGLAIVKNAVEFHNGKISARNRSGGGLEFLFSLAKYDKN